MKKRMMSLLLVAAMLLTLTPILGVSADDGVTYVDIPANQGWRVNYASSAPQSSTRVANLVKGDAYSGNYALHVTSDVAGELSIYNTAFTDSSVESKVYEFSFYAKGFETLQPNDYARAQIGWGGWTNHYENEIGVTAKFENTTSMKREAAENGWTRFYTKFDGSTKTSSSGGFRFNVYSTVENLIIDDVCMTVVGDATNTNLLQNGGFEDGFVEYEDLPNGSVWNVNYRAAAQSDTRVVNVAVGEAYTGDRSLHITSDVASELSINNTSFGGADADPTATYTLSFYIKNIDGISGDNDLYAQVGWGGWVNTYGDLGTVVKVKDGAAMKRDTNTDKEGWIRVYTNFSGEKMATVTDKFRFNVNGIINNIYIDDISLVKVGEESVNLLSESTFEVAPPATPEPTPTPTPTTNPVSYRELDTSSDFSDYWKTADTTLTAKIATGKAYEGSNSLYVTDGGTTQQITLRPLKADKSHPQITSLTDQFKLTFYMAGDYTDSAANFQIGMGWVYNDRFNDNQPLAWKCSDTAMNPLTAEDAAKAEEGWKKYELTFYGTHADPDGDGTLNVGTLQFVFMSAYEVYIDNVSLVKVGEESTELLANGTFEVVAATPTPAPTATPVPQAIIYKDMEFTTTDYWKYGNNVVAPNNADGNLKVQVATGKAYEGNNSLYLYGDDQIITMRPLMADGTNPKITSAADEYKITFYMAGDYTDAGNNIVIGMGWKYADQVSDGKPMAWKCSDAAMDPKDPEDAAKAAQGWKKYEFTICGANADPDGDGTLESVGTLEFTFQKSADYALYLDNISCVKVGGDGSNLLANGDFEFDTPVDYLVDAIKIYDGTTEINDLTTVSGKTVTIKVKVGSFDLTKLATSQLIVALYDGYEMKKVNISDAFTFTADGQIVELTTTIDMPTYTSVGDLKLKAFAWDSIEGMQALAGVKQI